MIEYAIYIPRINEIYCAKNEIIEAAGIKFDRELVKLFARSVAAYPTGTIVRLNDERCGIVIRQNAEEPVKPIIRMVKPDGEGWICGEEKNLSEEVELFIVDTVE